MLTVVQDPFGIMERVSRKFQAGFMGFYGRWYLPIPRRVAVSIVATAYKCEKMASPTNEQVWAAAARHSNSFFFLFLFALRIL